MTLRVSRLLWILAAGFLAAGCVGRVIGVNVDDAGEELAGQGGRGGVGGRGGAASTPDARAGGNDAQFTPPPEESPDGSAESGAVEVGAEEAGQPPAGISVPVIVVLGDGGFTMASCDLGRTWRNQQQFSEERGDHSPWTAFAGLAFGAGRFVAATGWGAPGHIIASATGTHFTEVLPNSATGVADSISAIAYTGEEFLAFSRRLWRSTNGVDWVASAPTLPPGAQQLRQLRAFAQPKLVVAAVENQSGEGHDRGNFVLVSEDGGKAWVEGTGFDPACGDMIQHRGDIAMVGDTIVVAAERVCRSTDRGKTWQALGQLAEAPVSGLFSDATSFFAIAGGRLHKSSDGADWELLGAPSGGADFGVTVRGILVVMKADGSNIAYSQDGKEWTKSERLHLVGAQRVRDVTWGQGVSSPMCPPPQP